MITPPTISRTEGISPTTNRAAIVPLSFIWSGCFCVKQNTKRVIADKNTLPNVIAIAGSEIHFTNNPAAPNSRTDTLTSNIERGFFIE